MRESTFDESLKITTGFVLHIQICIFEPVTEKTKIEFQIENANHYGFAKSKNIFRENQYAPQKYEHGS